MVDDHPPRLCSQQVLKTSGETRKHHVDLTNDLVLEGGANLEFEPALLGRYRLFGADSIAGLCIEKVKFGGVDDQIH